MAKLTKKKSTRRRRSTSEKIWIVIAILLAVSMVLTSVISLFS